MPAAWLRWRLGEGRLHVFQHKNVVPLRLNRRSQVQPIPPCPLMVFLSTASPRSLSTSRDSDPTPALGSSASACLLFQRSVS